MGPGKTENVTSLAERMLNEVDWASYRVAMGPATTFDAALQRLLSSCNVDEATAAWNDIEEHVFSQGTIYSAAEPTVSIMLAALVEDPPTWKSGRILDLLYFIVRGVSRTDPSLQDRCIARAHEGVWLLARWALTNQGWARANALELVDVIAPDLGEIIRSTIAAQGSGGSNARESDVEAT